MKEEITNAINNILDGRPTAKPYQSWEKNHREYLIENLGQLVLDYYNKALQVNQRYDTLGRTPLTFKPTTQQSSDKGDKITSNTLTITEEELENASYTSSTIESEGK